MRWTELGMLVVTLMLAVAAIFTAYSSGQMRKVSEMQAEHTEALVDISRYEYLPRVSISVESSLMPYVFEAERAYRAGFIVVDYAKIIEVPLNISIFNLGRIPVMLEYVYYDFSCGEQQLKQYELPDFSLIRSGELRVLEQPVLLSMTTPSEECFLRLIFSFADFAEVVSVPVKVRV